MKVLKRQTIMNKRESLERTYGYDKDGHMNLVKTENLDTGVVTIQEIETDPETKDRIEYSTKLDKDHNEIERIKVRTSFDPKGRRIKVTMDEEKDGVSSSSVITNTYDEKGRLTRYAKGDNYQESFEYTKDDEGHDLFYKYITEDGVNRLSCVSIDGKNGTICSKYFDSGNAIYFFYKHGRLTKVSSVIDDSKMNFVTMYKYNRAGEQTESFHKEYDENGKLLGVTIRRYNKDGEVIYLKDTLDNVEFSYEYTHVGDDLYKSKVINHITKEVTKYSYFLEEKENKRFLHVFVNGKLTKIKQWVYDNDDKERIVLYNDPEHCVTIRNEFVEI